MDATDSKGLDTVTCEEVGEELRCLVRRNNKNDRVIFKTREGTTTVLYQEDRNLSLNELASSLNALRNELGIATGLTGTLQAYWLTEEEANAALYTAGVLASRFIRGGKSPAAKNRDDVLKNRTNTLRGANTNVLSGGRKAASREFKKQTGQTPNSNGVSVGNNSAGQRVILRPAGNNYPGGSYIVEIQSAGGRFVRKTVFVK